MPLSAFSGKLSLGNGYSVKMPLPILEHSSVLAPTSSSAAKSQSSNEQRSSAGRSSKGKAWNSRF
jgi:hypothetical protein